MKKLLIMITMVAFLLPLTAQPVEILVEMFSDGSDTLDEGVGDELWGRGSIVLYRGDGWGWGKYEAPPQFFVVRIPGYTVEQAIDYMENSNPKRRVKPSVADSLWTLWNDGTLDLQPDTMIYNGEQLIIDRFLDIPSNQLNKLTTPRKFKQ